jgi:hypothetical protein
MMEVVAADRNALSGHQFNVGHLSTLTLKDQNIHGVKVLKMQFITNMDGLPHLPDHLTQY